MNQSKVWIFSAVLFVLVICVSAQDKPPLELVQTIPLPQLHDGDFDHFTVDVAGNRLFSTAEPEASRFTKGPIRVNMMRRPKPYT